MGRATWFCVDIECSGPVPGLYDMVSLGAVVVADPSGQDRADALVIGATHYVEIQPTGARVDAVAMAVNGLDIDDLRSHGTPMAEALDALTAFVREQTLAGTTPVFVGHNAPFDWSFVNHAYHASDRPNPFGYKALDTKALATGRLGMHWLDSNKEELAELLLLPDVEIDQVHRADYDAWYQAHILIALLQR